MIKAKKRKKLQDLLTFGFVLTFFIPLCIISIFWMFFSHPCCLVLQRKEEFFSHFFLIMMSTRKQCRRLVVQPVIGPTQLEDSTRIHPIQHFLSYDFLHYFALFFTEAITLSLAHRTFRAPSELDCHSGPPLYNGHMAGTYPKMADICIADQKKIHILR